MKKKTRYAVCGLSCRGIYHFVFPLLGKNHPGGPNFNETSELVAVLDIDERRVRAFYEKAGVQIPFYPPDGFGRMIAEMKPDVILVVSQDYSHCEYIVKGLRSGCDVIVEKPMVISGEQVRAVQEAERESGKRVRVAFNYRYAPIHRKLKRMIMEGKLGRITNVEFVYNLDTFHGASYFYRWNRERARSGGLSIHKCTHHFDLINWFLGDFPTEVFAYGALNYYGPNGAHRPHDAKGNPLQPVEEREKCPYFKKHYEGKCSPEDAAPAPGWDTFNLPYDVQYPPDQKRYIYDSAIDIEDTYSALVRFKSGASMSYSCNFSTPWEGYVLGINGTEGRIEINHHSNPDPTGNTAPLEEKSVIVFYPLLGGKQIIDIPPVLGGHGGADFTIQNDLFGKPSQESLELNLVAGSAEGAASVAVGEAVWRSIKEKRPVTIAELIG
ncbi:MAG: Gfo/Idh/MocA family oxidoreductase [Victivallales bacterium]|jgi:predicted dehydrogenase